MRIEAEILRIAERTPERSAIECDGRVISFGELAAQSGRWAEQLVFEGLGAGDPVWICMPNCPEFIAAALAIWRVGSVVVPINPRLTHHELAQLAEPCRPAAVFCESSRKMGNAFAGPIMPLLISPSSPGGCTDLSVMRPSCEDSKHAVGSTACKLQTDRGEPGVVYFTSGSTGRPKAILLRHESIAANAQATAQAFGIKPDDRTIVCMSMFHSFTLTKQIVAHLGCGATLVLAPDFFRPAVVLDLVERFQVTTLYAVPSMHVMLYEQMRRHATGLPTLRMLVTGGAPMPDRVQRGLCEHLPHASFFSSYGLSEAGPCVCALPAKWAVPKLGSIGQAIPGVQLMIADEADRPLPPGQVGELCVRSPGVMAGYVNDPASTTRVMRSGWLHTGDLAWQDADGCVYLCGRRDDLILRGGENVYPAEIENVLCNHPAVLEAAVIGMPHPVLGEDVVAFVRSADEGVHPDALREHCRAFLAAHKVPREVHVVQTLPHTSNGKLSRRALREGELSIAVGCDDAVAKELQ